MSDAPRPSFPAHSSLRAELNAEVDAYFARTGLDPAGGRPALLKTAVLLTWVIASYVLLLFAATTWWTAAPLAVSLGLALAAVGFNVMHDGNHGAFSTRPWLNRAAGASLDLMGGSSYLWRHKHNVLHHTYPNVEGLDDDIEFQPIFRLSDGQRRRWFHRFQHLYWVPLFVFFPTKWVFFDDFLTLVRGRTGRHPFPRPRGWSLAQLLAGKLFFVGWAIVLPLMVVPVLPYLLGYALVSAVQGLTLGTVFQLAHAVDTVQFARPPLSQPWVEHQLATTTDFARGGRLLTWYVGGLNMQVEHHLFPRIGHRHYPALAEIVRAVCARHGVTVHEHATVVGALRAHLRHLVRLGAPAPALVAHA